MFYNVMRLFLVLFIAGMIATGIRMSFIKYKVVIQAENCVTGKTTELTYIIDGNDTIELLIHETAVPILHIGHNAVLNVCDYKIIKKEEIK
jgi:hypothetical protein